MGTTTQQYSLTATVQAHLLICVKFYAAVSNGKWKAKQIHVKIKKKKMKNSNRTELSSHLHVSCLRLVCDKKEWWKKIYLFSKHRNNLKKKPELQNLVWSALEVLICIFVSLIIFFFGIVSPPMLCTRKCATCAIGVCFVQKKTGLNILTLVDECGLCGKYVMEMLKLKPLFLCVHVVQNIPQNVECHFITFHHNVQDGVTMGCIFAK